MRGRDASIVLVAMLLLSTFTCVVTFVPENVRATTLFVGGVGPGNYTTIQDAIDAAGPGDTVYVYGGTYLENVLVDNPLSMIGEGMNTTRIDSGGWGPVMRVRSDWVNVSGFTLTNAGTGFSDVGLDLNNAHNCRIVNNNVSSNKIHGIFLSYSDNNTISNNIASLNRFRGIGLEYSNNNTIVNNNASYNYRGIRLDYYSTHNTIINNNASSGYTGIVLDHYSNNNLVADNIASYHINGTGLGAAFSNNNTFTRNIVSSSRDGLILSHAIHTTVSENTVSSNRWRGVAMWYSDNNTISNSDVLSNGDGIFFEGSNLNTIINNSISNTGTGMKFYSNSNNNSFTHNSVHRNFWGLHIQYSSNNTVANNTISDNTGLGLRIDFGIGWRATVGNRIYHNHFLGNSEQAIDHTDTNQWDNGYPSGGNHWSDYGGHDFFSGPNQDQFGNDGIGDTPYVIDSDSQDRFPLMDFSVPAPPTNLTTQVVNFDDILLHWLAPNSSSLNHYLIYRSMDQRNFDFSSPLHNTSSDPNPLWNSWKDVDVASPNAPEEYYYVVRAVSRSGGTSFTSNTAGKWTRSFRQGREAFSLPLEPFVNRNASWYSENIPGTEFIRWMNSSGHWVTHYPSMGEGVNDVPAIMSDSYEISLSSPINFTFCGYPASMIRFHEGMGDSIAFRKSLSVQVEGNDINLSWEAVTGAIGYLVFRSDERNGLHDLSLSPIANITNTHWIDSGVVGSWRSEYYYMVIPADPSGGLGSSTYSIGVFTEEYQSGTDAFALPLKPVEPRSLDWYCDNIPNIVGIIHLMKGYWRLHAREMPEGVYDAEAVQGEGYQISIDGATTTYTFVGY